MQVPYRNPSIKAYGSGTAIILETPQGSIPGLVYTVFVALLSHGNAIREQLPDTIICEKSCYANFGFSTYGRCPICAWDSKHMTLISICICLMSGINCFIYVAFTLLFLIVISWSCLSSMLFFWCYFDFSCLSCQCRDCTLLLNSQCLLNILRERES